MLRVTEARMRELWATCAASEHRRLVEPQAKSFDTKQRAALERVLYGDAGRGKRSRAVVATLDGTDRVLPGALFRAGCARAFLLSSILDTRARREEARAWHEAAGGTAHASGGGQTPRAGA